MGINPEYAEDEQGKKQAMSDLVTANYLVETIGGAGRVNETLYRAYRKLAALFPHTEDAGKQWTERRLRGWRNNESDRVLHWQMLELYEAATKAKEERVLLRKAKREHAEFIQKTARLAALLEHQDEAFAGPQIEALRSMGRRVRGARVEGE